MTLHWKGILAVFSVMVAVFAAALVTHSMYFAIVALLLGLVLAFIMATAWMRPPGSPREHHAPGDKIMNDTRP